MLQIQAYLIHNADPARQAQRQAIASLLTALEIPLTAIHEQPPLVALPRGWSGRWLLQRLSSARVTADFAQRRLREPRRVLDLRCRQAWVQLKGAWKLWVGSEVQLEALWRQLQVELIVSGKHGQAWRQALQSGVDAALVFEDDVTTGPASLERCTHLLQALPDMLSRHRRLYCDLAGGYPLEQVLPLHQASPGDGPMEMVLPGVHTNTACAYLVSRPLLEAWRRVEARHQGLARLPIDHRINRASAIGAEGAICGHWQEPPFRHGSFCGLVRSWQS
jgi:hypothetical protein